MTQVSHPSPTGMAGKWQAGDVKEADSNVGQSPDLGSAMDAKVAQVSNFPADAQTEEHSKFLHQMMPDND